MVSIHGDDVESKGAHFLAQMSLAQRTRALKTKATYNSETVLLCFL